MKKIFLFTLVLLSFISSWATDVKVDFITPRIVRVQWSPDGALKGNNTGVCIWQENASLPEIKVTERRENGFQILTSEALTIRINEHSGEIEFIDAKSGRTLLKEEKRTAERVVQERIVYDDKTAHMEETANGKVTVKEIIRRDTIGTSTRFCSSFLCNGTKALYGLGAHMEDYMNLLEKTLWLTQHNLKATVPVLISPQGYGLLFDAGCAMKYSSHQHTFSMQMEAAKQLDYYFILGKGMEEIVKGYHLLTGKVQLIPKYAFGYIQSKERYVSSEDLISTLREYRRRHVPIDMIVQDWNYWPEGWGYMKMNPKYYPDPKALADSIHAMNAKLMVSIWPNPQYCPQERDFREKGYMLEHSVYDVFNTEARKHYWKYAYEEFFSKGFDAWWCDSSEPLDGDWNKIPEPIEGKAYGWNDHERRWHLNKDILSDALGAERSSLYSLYHSKGLYENQRLTGTEKRVLNLTRSSFAGQQRYATVVWNGDTHASWQSFRQQIPAGLNYMATGNPYWTVDVGSFFTRNDSRRWFYTGEFQKGVEEEEYREYYTRMFQWATFLPMLRSHGSDTPREIWRFGEPGTEYYDAILKMIRLRYELLPYIYSMAAHQTLYSYSMARMLAFDYPDDEEVYDIKDEFLFGDILVCPVTHPRSETTIRKIYLPKGNQWVDYWSNKLYDGGQWLSLETDIHSLPLFVKAGTIIPKGEVVEYSAAQADKQITIEVFPGADAQFTLYEDSGDGYEFEKGEYRETVLSWNDRKKELVVNGKKNKRFIVRERILW